MSSLPLLTLLESRILGVLVEKQHTVPDTYPLSLNALTAGCNQKTSRDPVINATESEVLEALDNLRSLSLTMETSGGRVSRYAHNVERVLRLPNQSVALIATLMLRGPQTAAELRANSERFHRFADVSSVEAFLDELSQRAEGALVVMLPRAPGSRENRWAHLLCGEPQVPQYTAAAASTSYPSTSSAGHSEVAALRAEVAKLAQEVTELRAQLSKVCAELGM